MDLRQMEYLVTLADEQQFTRAAALCGVSQSGLSAAIRSLEEELGTTLFNRTTRSVEPTDAGRALLPHARTMLAHAVAARDAVGRASRELTGRLRVGTEQCLGVVDVNALLERVHRRHPLVDLDFAQAGSHELIVRVREGDMDLAFIASGDRLSGIERVELGRQPLVLLVPTGHPLAASDRIDWSDVREHDFVDFHESWAVRSLNDTAAAMHGVARRIRCTVNDVHTLLDLVHRGLGVAIVPRHVASKPQADGLRIVSMPADAPTWVVSAITATAPSASARLAIDLLRVDAVVA